MAHVHRLEADDIDEVVRVLRDAFVDYPVMRYVLADAGADYDHRLDLLLRFFASARFDRGEPVFGVRGGRQALAGVALVSGSDGPPGPARLAEKREALRAELGADARDRYERFGRAAARFTVAEPHLHLNMIGVRARSRGSGAGRLLLERVHSEALEQPRYTGVTLSTEDPANLPLYRHFGYEDLGSAMVAPKLRTWGFFRSAGTGEEPVR